MSDTVRLYHFVKDQFGCENIQNRRLKVSFANQVNDLFELMPFDFGPIKPGRKVRKAWKKAIDEHARSQGFISFSQSWNVPTMWAHYANNHRGVCLGFDVAKENCHRIDYVDDLMAMTPAVLTDEKYNEEMVDYAKRTKSGHWAYEREWRCWITLNEQEIKEKETSGSRLSFLDFSEKLVLRKVILGARSRLRSKDLRALLQPSDDIEFKTSRPSFRAFSMVEQKNPKYEK